MKHLERLSPAETLIVTQGKTVKLKELLKVTLMDLLLKQVLQTRSVQSLDIENKTLTYVIEGENFTRYRPLEHEQVFLGPFYRNPATGILFGALVKIVYSKTFSASDYSEFILANAHMQGCFYTGLMRFFKGRFALTPYGQNVCTDVKSELLALDNTLPQLIQSNPESASVIMKQIKGNVFLVNGINFKMMEEVDKEVVAHSNYLSADSSLADALMFFALTHHHSSAFDDTDHHGSSEADWGASGDHSDSGNDSSGCSGCGGDVD